MAREGIVCWPMTGFVQKNLPGHCKEKKRFRGGENDTHSEGLHIPSFGLRSSLGVFRCNRVLSVGQKPKHIIQIMMHRLMLFGCVRHITNKHMH